MPSKTKSLNWSELRKTLTKWEVPELVDLIKELHGRSPETRQYLHARLARDADDESVLQPYCERITREFYPAKGFGKLRLAEARKAIRDYRKASGNSAGTAELMLTYLENGTCFVLDFGNPDERFYDSLSSVLHELVTLLISEGPELYPRFRERLLNLEDNARPIGWGYGDEVVCQFARLEGELAEWTAEASNQERTPLS